MRKGLQVGQGQFFRVFTLDEVRACAEYKRLTLDGGFLGNKLPSLGNTYAKHKQ